MTVGLNFQSTQLWHVQGGYPDSQTQGFYVLDITKAVGTSDFVNLTFYRLVQPMFVLIRNDIPAPKSGGIFSVPMWSPKLKVVSNLLLLSDPRFIIK